MFVGVARCALQIADSGSLKSKRQVLRRITDRVKARFNASVAEVEDQDLWQRATIAFAVVGNERRHVDEQLEKILHFVEEMYLAPLLTREREILAFGEQLFASSGGGPDPATLELPFAREDRSLAEAEGMASWERRPEEPLVRRAGQRTSGDLTLGEARARARSLRNRRDWEKP
ncbi:MAG TPA: DUF503 domain-containing protein [Myxococcaceae bacterium]|nr:DUF503 domain-containing protein [Myxococcaceae bacterium]